MQDGHHESIERLFNGILALKTVDECAALFEDLCTIREIEDMAQRLDTAILLKQGKNYSEIQQDVSISTATISRVSRCLNYGKGGYELVIDRLENKLKNEQ